MRYGTVRSGEETFAAAVVDGRAVELCAADVRALLEGGAAATRPKEGGRSVELSAVDWAPLVPHPEKVICLGLNFLSHIQEMGREVPEYPTLFSKFSRALIGASDPIRLPSRSESVDWEAELALVIGKPGRDVEIEDARDIIAGFTVLNDVSMRDFQHRTTQWLQGKTFEESTPVGPVLVPGDDIDWAADLVIRCFVDDEKVQEIRTADLLFKAEEIVAYCSRIITLDPGDIISLGTGGGVGSGRVPPKYLHHGQVLATEIEGIGALQNECVADAADLPAAAVVL